MPLVHPLTAMGKLTCPLMVLPVMVTGPDSADGSLKDQTFAPTPIPMLNNLSPMMLLLVTVTPA